MQAPRVAAEPSVPGGRAAPAARVGAHAPQDAHRGRATWSKCLPKQRPSSAPAPPYGSLEGAPGGSGPLEHSQGEAQPLKVQPRPRGRERAASKVADSTAFDRPCRPRRGSAPSLLSGCSRCATRSPSPTRAARARATSASAPASCCAARATRPRAARCCRHLAQWTPARCPCAAPTASTGRACGPRAAPCFGRAWRAWSGPLPPRSVAKGRSRAVH